MSARYALYFAPEPDSRLWRFGSDLLGRDAATGQECGLAPDLPVDVDLWRGWTTSPARYGFHATIKAPFELREEGSEAALLREADALARRLDPVLLPPLAVSLLGPFAALVLTAPCPALDRLAAAVVEAFEPFRAPLDQADRKRRLGADLTPRQAAYLDRFGYPYVLDEFRFHMTLAGPLPPERREAVRAWLAVRYAAIAEPVTVDALAVLRQPSRDAPFVIIQRLTLHGQA